MNTETTFVVTASFEAARHVDVLPVGHRSRNTHGHSFLATVYCDLPNGFAAYTGGEIDAIKTRFEPQVRKLDYGLLNDHVDSPTDENIARWINTQCCIPGTEAIAVQSTNDEGLQVDNSGQTHVWRLYHFQAAHQLPNVPPDHKCGNMHGHGFAVVLHATHRAGDGDLIIDYDHINTRWAPVFEELDHACLNEIDGLRNPTSELISRWIWDKVKPGFPELSSVTVYETASCGASYDGSNFQIWKEFTLDSAVRFEHAPEGNKRRLTHGYTYTLRLHLSAPLDQVMGWAVDFGDVKEMFNPIFRRIDHKLLNEIPDLADCDPSSIAHWIFKRAVKELPDIYRVDLFETMGCGVIVSSGQAGPRLPLQRT